MENTQKFLHCLTDAVQHFLKTTTRERVAVENALHEALRTSSFGSQVGRAGLNRQRFGLTKRLYGASDVITKRSVVVGRNDQLELSGDLSKATLSNSAALSHIEKMNEPINQT